jgi:hypothetical protein
MKRQPETCMGPLGLFSLTPLARVGLKAKAPAKPVSKPARSALAAELAAKAIEGMIDPSAHPEERAQRWRRLTKGPEEFQEVRVDRPKLKK